MKVIVASFPKCGTKTLHRALDILGYSVHDFDSHAFQNSKEWLHFLKHGTDKSILRKMYENVDCICDIPANYYWEELLDAFPDSKVILTMRSNEEEWFKSFKKQCDLFNSSLSVRSHLVLTPTGRRALAIWQQLSYVMFSCPPQPYTKWLRYPNAQIQKRRYREHNDAVLQRVPKDKLLVLNLSDGWEPMCRFLGKEVPDVPFPHENANGVIAETAFNLPLFIQMGKELRVVMAVLVLLVSALCYVCLRII